MKDKGEIAVRIQGVGKYHRLYAQHGDKLRQAIAGGRRRYYREFWALRDINLDLKRGEMLGVIGENGAGKSTLLQIVCGTMQPSLGRVTIHGRMAAMLELGAGFNMEFTGRENVELSAAVLGLTQQEIRDRFDEIAAFADIGHFMDLPVKTYSSGMYARLAFAVCAHVDADILIVDEILSVGDAIFQQKCMRFLRAFSETGTLLFVSHDSGLVAKLCRRALWLEHGRVRGLGPADEICAEYLQSKLPKVAESDAKQNAQIIAAPPLVRDARIRRANRIEISPFDPDAPWHGVGGATIEEVGFYSLEGMALDEIRGGDEVELHIACRAERPLGSPILGFILRDHMGQAVLGDNTFYAYRGAPLQVGAGEHFSARFRFQFPYLAVGDYTLAPSINQGTQAEHVHIHWIEDGLVLRAVESPVSMGIVGVPAQEIRIQPLG